MCFFIDAELEMKGFGFWRLIGKISGVLLTILLWYLQEIPSDSNRQYDLFLREHKIVVASVAAFIIVAAIIIDDIVDYFTRRNKIENWSKSFLKHIVEEHLGGGDYQTRITIFRPCKGYRIVLPYLLMYPIKAILRRKYKVRNKSYWENLPMRLFDDYLSVYARYEHSDNNYSYTHFLLTNRDEPYNGVADKCYRERLEQEVCTKRILGENIPCKYDDANNKVKRYMSDTYLAKEYYNSLRLMNIKSNNLYAVPIFTEDQHIWGVMMIDNDSSEEIHYKERLDPYIAMYVKIFSYTLKILNR